MKKMRVYIDGVLQKLNGSENAAFSESVPAFRTEGHFMNILVSEGDGSSQTRVTIYPVNRQEYEELSRIRRIMQDSDNKIRKGL